MADILKLNTFEVIEQEKALLEKDIAIIRKILPSQMKIWLAIREY